MIKIEHLTKRYGQQPVIQDLNLDIQTGEVVGIIGPSGAGKSTLLRCLNLLEVPEAGTVTVSGRSYHAPKVSAAERIRFRQASSMVFQQFNLFRQKTVLGNVMEGLITVKRLAPAAARNIAIRQLARVQLLPQQDMFPGQLSGGQKQRVGIARALAMNASTLLLDEPTSALDTELVDEVLQTIKAVVQQNRDQTTIIISHELSFIQDVATRVLFFEQGRIIEDGTPDALFNHPQCARTQQFLSRYQSQRWPLSV